VFKENKITIKIDENKFEHAMKIRQSAQQMNQLRRLLASTSTVIAKTA
jgi:hypothetical protein